MGEAVTSYFDWLFAYVPDVTHSTPIFQLWDWVPTLVQKSPLAALLSITCSSVTVIIDLLVHPNFLDSWFFLPVLYISLCICSSRTVHCSGMLVLLLDLDDLICPSKLFLFHAPLQLVQKNEEEVRPLSSHNLIHAWNLCILYSNFSLKGWQVNWLTDSDFSHWKLR